MTYTQIFFPCECGHVVTGHKKEGEATFLECLEDGCKCLKYQGSFKARTEWTLEHLENRIEELEAKLEDSKKELN